MHSKVPDFPVAMAIFWIWVAIVCTGFVTYKVYRWWRRRHPLPKPAPPKSFSSALRDRLDAGRAAKRRAKPKPGPKRPHHRP